MKSFYKEASNQHILFNIGNILVIAINKIGRMVLVEMNVVVHEIWNWAQSTKKWITATYISGIFNVDADKESLDQEKRTEWMLSKTAFDDIINQVEFKLDINLFACRINNQIPKSVSLKPDLEFIAVNAFNMD